MTPDPGGWIRPTVTGYIVELREKGQHVIANARLVEEVDPVPLRPAAASA